MTGEQNLGTPAVEVADVGVDFRDASGATKPVLDRVSVSVQPGEFVSVIGPSGCGKSTLLNVMGGLQPVTRGQVLVDGVPMTAPRPTQVSIVFQDYGLFPWLTVQRNVEFGLKMLGKGKVERSRRATESLRRVNLVDAADLYPSQLSGGMRQRVAVARSLSVDSPIILMDEPFGALDEQTRIILGEDFSALLANEGRTIVMVTHSLDEAAFLSDRVVVMGGRPGTVIAELPVDEAHPRTASFMSSALSQETRNKLFELLHDEMRAAAEGRITDEPR